MKTIRQLASVLLFILVAGAVRAEGYFFLTDEGDGVARIENGRIQVDLEVMKIKLPQAKQLILSSHEEKGSEVFQVQANFDPDAAPEELPVMTLDGVTIIDELSMSYPPGFSTTLEFETEDRALAQSVFQFWIDELNPGQAWHHRVEKGPPVTYLPDLERFLSSIDDLIENQEWAHLTSVQASPDESGTPAVEKLAEELGDRTLSELYAERTFPEDAESFKLGGHDSELGHIHIDFTKHHHLWRLERIWQCR